jgi:MFS family permease
MDICPLTLFLYDFPASIISFSQMFGAVICGLIANHFGRKRCIALYSLISSGGWLIIGFSNGNEAVMLVGRAICGFGIMTSTGQVFHYILL